MLVLVLGPLELELELELGVILLRGVHPISSGSVLALLQLDQRRFNKVARTVRCWEEREREASLALALVTVPMQAVASM